MKIKNMLNVNQEEKIYKTFKGVSKTIPDLSMSLHEILSRYSRGLSIDGEKTPIWDEEGLSMGIHPKTLDLVDIQRLNIENKEEIENLKSAVGMNERKAKRKASESAIVEHETEKQ